MPCGPVDVLSLERASGTGRLPFGREHQMMHDQLAAAVEQFGQRAASTRGIEHVALLYSQPRQGATFRGEGITCTHVRLLLREEHPAGDQPFILRYDLGRLHRASPSTTSLNDRLLGRVCKRRTKTR